jgi:hypothetical protein
MNPKYKKGKLLKRGNGVIKIISLESGEDVDRYIFQDLKTMEIEKGLVPVIDSNCKEIKKSKV